ncbi:HNH endonuclease [Stenotrophomonas oahuensis]|uniref:HNH endonuclease signature motif containing protein n=1 Tax=Stenotrophomonas oahuensis TaxID=3003271 RepID=A0ABY9YVB9_9GAMM|nr:HNH endonuclease signature motif containing protein [Stenotrophomonas sp. A5586]WNH54812.1 HNH endonuclease signature motif containing protein [Stenotrophomonas sp. A5586]
MRLNKHQRELVRMRYDGRCAYCGEMLGARWHADHLVSVGREFVFVAGGTRATGKLSRPENDQIDNLMPACVPCNIDKHSMSLEAWRAKLARACDVLASNIPTYRHAVRFGLVRETKSPVIFYFERRAVSKERIACELCDRTADAFELEAAAESGWSCGLSGWLCPVHSPGRHGTGHG